MTKENMRVLSNGSYLVRTQAGFNKAIKHWLDDNDHLYRPSWFNYPKKYPSVVRLWEYYQGYHGYNCTCTPLNEYKSNLKNLLEELERE